MSAVVPVTSKKSPTPDLAELRKRFPLTVTNLGALPDREAWLARIWDLESRWRSSMESDWVAPEVIIKGRAPVDLFIRGEYDIVYAGGALGLLHAAVMAVRYNRRVMVFDAHKVGKTDREWNISDEDLREFEKAGLFNRDELESVVRNRYQSGFVKFHDGGSRVKAPPLWIEGVLDVALDAESLLQLARSKIEASGTGSLFQDKKRLVRCWTEPGRVVVEVEDIVTGERSGYAGRLLIDSTGPNSPVSRQLNDGLSLTHICPTVGTVAKGFTRGKQPDHIDFNVGEILVSIEDASDHRQLIWEGFPGNPWRDEYTTYLFFHDAVNSKADKSLLGLFERYFASLPHYKSTGPQWRVAKPIFGYIPSFHHRGKENRRKTADDCVMLIGDAAGLSSPLAFCGFGTHVRDLYRQTAMTEEALTANALNSASLAGINSCEPRLAQMASLAEFLRPAEGGSASAVNETLNAVMSALHRLDERVRRELFQDRMSFDAMKSLLAATARIYPQIFQRVREHLGVRGTLWWLKEMAQAAWRERK